MVQSEQSWSLEITSPRTLAAVLAGSDRTAGRSELLLAHPAPDSMAIDAALAPCNGEAEITLLIGPEGGFTDEEIERSRAKGAHLVTLGATRLRTETAAIVALALALEALRRNPR